MNRPKYKHFKKKKNKSINGFINHLLIYKRDLEKYCDEVEQATNYLYGEKLLLEEKVYELSKFQLYLFKEKAKVEKALDKACKLIDDNYGSCPYDVKEFCLHKGECDGNSIKCWKEWLLKDD